MEIGDTVLAKKGKTIVGIGKVTSDYFYDDYPDWEKRFEKELGTASVDDPYVEIPYSKTRLDDVDARGRLDKRKIRSRVLQLQKQIKYRQYIADAHTQKEQYYDTYLLSHSY